jgi:beta-lactamase class A
MNMTDLPWTRRRLLIAGSGAIALAAGVTARPVCAAVAAESQGFAELERNAGGRLGVTALDTGSGQAISHRGDERFGFCSTFKLLLAAIVLREADQGRLTLDTRVRYSAADMVPYAPVTERHLDQGYMTIGALAEAAQVTSDNVAANLLLGVIGGPAGFTALLRAAGDDTTRLDRLEPTLNVVPPGELRDTTTPMAMSRTVARLLTSDYLSAASRSTLIDWMVSTRTGLRRLRAGLPADWRAGDKTGTGMSEGMANKYNDVAIVFPPHLQPLVVSAFYESPTRSGSVGTEDEAVLAAVGRIVADWSTRISP